jgi:L-fuconate dehydratase
LQQSPEQLVDLVDFRYLTDVLNRDAAGPAAPAGSGEAARGVECLTEGLPASTTSPGRLGYDDGKLCRLLEEAVAAGFPAVKLKVGAAIRPIKVATGSTCTTG